MTQALAKIDTRPRYYDVIPLGDDGECYIIEGHDRDAGWRLALYLCDEGIDVQDISNLDPPVRVWLVEEYHMPADEIQWDEEGPFYKLCKPDDEGAKPYTAVTYGWKNWRDIDDK